MTTIPTRDDTFREYAWDYFQLHAEQRLKAFQFFIVASLESIADACDVLRSAIADVRNIIHQADGLMDLPEPHLYTISQAGWA